MIFRGPAFTRRERTLVVLFSVLYLVSGLARFNYSACLSSLLESERFARAEAGLIGTFSFFFFAAGTFFSAGFVRRLGPKKVLTGMLVVLGICNLVFYRAHSLPLMIAAWSVNGFVEGLALCAVVTMLEQNCSGPVLDRASRAVQLFFFFGTSFAYLVSAVCIRLGNWRTAFLTAGILCFAFAAVCGCVFRGYREFPEREDGASGTPGTGFALRRIRRCGILAIAVPLFVQGVLRDGITTWGPTMIRERYPVGPSFSVVCTAILPFVSVAGILISPFLRRIFSGNEFASEAAVCGTAALCALLLSGIVPMGLGGWILAAAAVTVCMAASNAFLVNAVPLHFAGENLAGVLTAAFNSFVYVGSGISTCASGAYSATAGWERMALVWFLLAAIAFTVSALLIRNWGRAVLDGRAGSLTI